MTTDCVCSRALDDQDEQTTALSSNTTPTWTLKMRMSLLTLAGPSEVSSPPHPEKIMSYARTTTKNSATGLLGNEAPGTMLRLGFGAIALAWCLLAVSGDARAQQAPEELAYCTRLNGLFWKYHANFFHHDGTWVQAELARSDCDHGKLEAGTRQLERILRDDLFVIPEDRSPTYIGFAPR
jgi:hypothetical protein